jgi:DNA adenine methylase
MTRQKQAARTSRKASAESLPKPFIKWAGGKGQLVSKLLERAPTDFASYHEPFMGGAALFFALYRQGKLKGKKVFLTDINQELVDTYTAIRDQLESVIRHLRKHKYEKDYYYEVRSWEPDKLTPAKRAARMIFLNRTGFNGLYRVNSKGKFNVPFGRYVNPTICDANNLRAVSKALQGVKLGHESFEKVLKRAKKNDLVYFDPPYVPVSKTAKFVSYASHGFDLDDQGRLAEVFSRLARRGALAMLSNSDTPWVKKQFERFKQDRVLARRSVNSRKDRRGPVGELVVTSYSAKEAS